MRLSLSTDFGSQRHWRRLIDFAARHGVQRVVYWADSATNPLPGVFKAPLTYPRYPGLMPAAEVRLAQQRRERIRWAAEQATAAGLEFWSLFQVLELPDVDLARVAYPSWFNTHGEPDMANPAIYQLIRDQLDELFEVAPQIAGVELWVMECATVVIELLQHQTIPRDEICRRIFDTVYDQVTRRGRRLDQDLHTNGGDSISLEALFDSARLHPDVMISGDHVVGDYHILLPFHDHLRRAVRTNPVCVNFDVNGENFGRNFIPSCNLAQTAEHLEVARSIGATWVNARVATAHDIGNPHANVLPARRAAYPGIEGITPATAVPVDLEVLCTDTLGAFNAEFFCRRVADPTLQPAQVVRDFLEREFGPAAAGLTPAFLRLDRALARIIYADKNYYGSNRIVPKRAHIYNTAVELHLTCPAGVPFPTAEARRTAPNGFPRVGFHGWTVPLGHVAAGAEAMIQEKDDGVAEAEALLADVRAGAGGLRPEDRAFLVRQFEDLVLVARINRLLLEAHAHFFHLEQGRARGPFPNRGRLQALLTGLDRAAGGWEVRYPGGRYHIAMRVRDWVARMAPAAG